MDIHLRLLSKNYELELDCKKKIEDLQNLYIKLYNKFKNEIYTIYKLECDMQ